MAPFGLIDVDAAIDLEIFGCIEEMKLHFPANLLRALSEGDSRGFADDEDIEELEMKSRIFFDMALGYQGHVLKGAKLTSGATYHERICEIISKEKARIYLYVALRRTAWATEG